MLYMHIDDCDSPKQSNIGNFLYLFTDFHSSVIWQFSETKYNVVKFELQLLNQHPHHFGEVELNPTYETHMVVTAIWLIIFTKEKALTKQSQYSILFYSIERP